MESDPIDTDGVLISMESDPIDNPTPLIHDPIDTLILGTFPPPLKKGDRGGFSFQGTTHSTNRCVNTVCALAVINSWDRVRVE